MDRNRFDALARLLGSQGSRRTALGAVLGAAVAGTALESEARANGKGKHGRKKKKSACFGRRSCSFLTDGKDLENCNLAGITLADCDGCNFRGADLGGADLSNGSFQGVSFRAANLRGANFEDADVSGVSFRYACLVDATFLGANTDGAHFGGAILCNTTLSDGRVSNRGCDKTTACCPGSAPTGCAKDSDCGGTEPYCCDEVCSEFCCLDSQCPGQESCDEGVCKIPNPTCAADPDACADGFIVCGGTGGAGTCFCYVTTEDESRCVNINQITNPFCAGTPCESSDDCAQGEFCAALHGPTTCCTAKICGRECPEFGASARAARKDRGITPPHS